MEWEVTGGSTDTNVVVEFVCCGGGSQANNLGHRAASHECTFLSFLAYKKSWCRNFFHFSSCCWCPWVSPLSVSEGEYIRITRWWHVSILWKKRENTKFNFMIIGLLALNSVPKHKAKFYRVEIKVKRLLISTRKWTRFYAEILVCKQKKIGKLTSHFSFIIV